MKKVLKTVLALVLVVVLLLSCTACKKSDLQFVKNKGTLNVGITLYYPMDYFADDGETIVGFDAEMARLVAKELGVNVSFVLIKWGSKILELNSGTIDCIWNGMTVTEELQENLTLSSSYAENQQVAVVKKSNASRINSIETVKNASIAAESESKGESVAKETLKASKVVSVGSQNAALMEVVSGASECCIIDLTMAAGLVGKGDFADLVIVDPEVVSFEYEEFAIGFRKGSDLADEVNKILKKLYADGTMQKVADGYPGLIKLLEIKQ